MRGGLLMRICLIATHSFPIPGPVHSGDVVILDLAHGLTELGHDVTLCAPDGTAWPRLIPMRPSFGRFPPSADECELEAWMRHRDAFMAFDFVHDFSVSKRITVAMNYAGRRNTCVTLMGGPWRSPEPPHNLVCWSRSHRDRVLRGATDYEGTTMPTVGGKPGRPVAHADFVYGGIDQSFYCPSDVTRGEFLLWLGRWNRARGYREAIVDAIQRGHQLVLAGEHPDNEVFADERACAEEAQRMAKGHGNIHFSWLPKDPDHHTAKRELYRTCREYLFQPLFHEPFGLSQVEARACGATVRGNEMGSIPEVSDTPIGVFWRTAMAGAYLHYYTKWSS
jgi:glycosyltransferase involved in cell wall biosynthesis